MRSDAAASQHTRTLTSRLKRSNAPPIGLYCRFRLANCTPRLCTKATQAVKTRTAGKINLDRISQLGSELRVNATVKHVEHRQGLVLLGDQPHDDENSRSQNTRLQS